jgi:hypothetical protein
MNTVPKTCVRKKEEIKVEIMCWGGSHYYLYMTNPKTLFKTQLILDNKLKWDMYSDLLFALDKYMLKEYKGYTYKTVRVKWFDKRQD